MFRSKQRSLFVGGSVFLNISLTILCDCIFLICIRTGTVSCRTLTIRKSISRKKILRRSAPTSKLKNSTKTKLMKRVFLKLSTTNKLPLLPKLHQSQLLLNLFKMIEKGPISNNKANLNHPRLRLRTNKIKKQTTNPDIKLQSKTKEIKNLNTKAKMLKKSMKMFLKTVPRKLLMWRRPEMSLIQKKRENLDHIRENMLRKNLRK